MSKNISVLSAIDSAIEGIHGEGCDCAELEDAYGAIAALIEACSYLKRDASNVQWGQFHIALARVRGDV